MLFLPWSLQAKLAPKAAFPDLVWKGDGQLIGEQQTVDFLEQLDAFRSTSPDEIHGVIKVCQCGCEAVVLCENSCWSGDVSVDWEKATLFPSFKNDRRKTEGLVGWSASPQPMVGSLDTSFWGLCSPWIAHLLAVHFQAHEGQEGNWEQSNGFLKFNSW